jgi:integrase
MNTTPNPTPGKPREDFPLSIASNGQWAKKVNQKRYYFGSVKTDPKGVAALQDWLKRKDAILAGMDTPTVAAASNLMSLEELKELYVGKQKSAVEAGDLSLRTLQDYLIELPKFVAVFGGSVAASALGPAHFSKFASTLIARKLGRHSRKRITAYIKAMFNWGAGNGHFPQPNYGTEFKAPDTSKSAMRQAKQRAGLKDNSDRIVTGLEMDRLLAECPAQFRALILLGVNCGLGPADLGRLTWSHINMETGELNMPRGKTGEERHGYVWQKTREALKRVMTLRHNKRALAKQGQAALVFWTRHGLPMYRETEKGGKVVVETPISQTFGKLAKRLKMDGVTFYRLRHTFKTLGKRAKDSDALNFMMGHAERSTGATYDHTAISFKRVKRVAVRVKKVLWKPLKKPAMKMVS